MATGFKQSKFYLGWQKFISDLKPMTGKQRLEYLWMYYKEALWIGALIVIVLSLVITSVINSNKEVLVSGMLVNITIDQEGLNYLDSEYFEDLGGDKKKHVQELLVYTDFSSMEDPTSQEDNYNRAMQLIARVEGRYLDYALLDQFGLEYYLPREVFLDLREFFTEEELKAFGNKVIWAMEEGTDDPVPLAIDITDLPFAVDNHINNGEKVYFALGGSTQRMEMCQDVWQRINDWESKE